MIFLSCYQPALCPLLISFIIAVSWISPSFAKEKNDGNFNPVSVKFVANEKLVEQQVAETLIKQIYKNVKIDATVHPVPPARGNIENLQQNIDGEIARIYPYGEKFPTLVRVEPPYYYLNSTAFCLHPDKIRISSKEDLKKYSVAVIRGVAHSDEATKDHPKKQIVGSGIQLYDLALNGRAEVVVDTGINGRKIINDPKYASIKECGTIAKFDLYNYLNSKSKKFQKIISKEVQRLKDNGELEKMILKAEEQVLTKK